MDSWPTLAERESSWTTTRFVCMCCCRVGVQLASTRNQVSNRRTKKAHVDFCRVRCLCGLAMRWLLLPPFSPPLAATHILLPLRGTFLLYLFFEGKSRQYGIKTLPGLYLCIPEFGYFRLPRNTSCSLFSPRMADVPPSLLFLILYFFRPCFSSSCFPISAADAR